MGENKKTIKKTIVVAIVILIVVSAIYTLSYIFKNIYLNIVRDIVVTLSLTASFTLNIDLSTKVTYLTNDKNVNSKFIEEQDNKVFKRIQDVFKRLDNYFIHRDFSMTNHSVRFEEIIKFYDFEINMIDFRFSNENLNSMLDDLKKYIGIFVFNYLEHTIIHNNDFIVTKLKYEEIMGRTVIESEKVKEENLLNESYLNMKNTFLKLQDEYYKLNSPH